MLKDSRVAIHFGVNFVLAPAPVIDGAHLRKFADALAEEGLEFEATSMPPGVGAFQRTSNRRLEVRVLHQQNAPIGQLLALAPNPGRTLGEFVEEAEGMCAAFNKVWPEPRNIVARDVAIRHLYDVKAEHAFQFLWEQRLKEEESQLQAFGRSVLGGGLRFVMPPIPNEPEPKQIEVKIESFLQDSRKLYVDVSCAWPGPARSPQLDPKSILEEVFQYATTEVVAFIEGDAR